MTPLSVEQAVDDGDELLAFLQARRRNRVVAIVLLPVATAGGAAFYAFVANAV